MEICDAGLMYVLTWMMIDSSSCYQLAVCRMMDDGCVMRYG